MSKAIDQEGKPYNRNMLVLLLLIGTFCSVLNQTVLATAFPTLMKYFSVNTSTVQLLSTGFMMVSGIFIPVSAWLSSRFNTKWLYMGAMITFEVGTVISYVAPTFDTLFAGRLIQAVGEGISMPLLQTIMLSIFPAEKRGTAMGIGGIVIGLAPALGPTLSGWVLQNYTWRLLFGIIIPIIGVVIVLGFFYLKPVLPTKKSKLDILSLILSTIGFGSLLWGFSAVGTYGWLNAQVVIELVVGVIFVVLFGWRQLSMKTPFLQLRVFKSSRFTIGTIIVSLVYVATIGVEMILPMYLQVVEGINAFMSGLVLLPGALLTGLMSPFTGQIFDRYGARNLAICGLFLLSLGTLPFMFFQAGTSLIFVIVFYAVRMFGGVMVRMPVMTYGMNSLPLDMMGHGTAVSNTVRQVASAIGTAIMVSILANVTTAMSPSKHMLKVNPIAYQHLSVNATLSGYVVTFGIAFGVAAVAYFLAFFIKKGAQPQEDVKVADEGGEA